MAGKANIIWYAYPDLGLCFRLENDVLQAIRQTRGLTQVRTDRVRARSLLSS